MSSAPPGIAPRSPLASRKIREFALQLSGNRLWFPSGSGGSGDAGWCPSGVRGLLHQEGILSLRLLVKILGVLALQSGLVGCSGGGGDSDSLPAAAEVPTEIRERIAALEEAINARSAEQYAAILDDRASIQSVALLGYGRKDAVVEALREGRSRETVRFGKVEVVSSRPQRVRTISEVEIISEGDRTRQRVAHDWVLAGDAWVLREQSYPDWSPVVGAWTRGEGESRLLMRMHPDGRFEMLLGEGGLVGRSGTYAFEKDLLVVTPDALGAGGTSEGRLEYRQRFELDGTLVLDSISGREDSTAGGIAGSWRRQ